MKTIIWIDDSISMMSYLAKGFFPELWKNDYFNHIIFVGNDYKHDNPELERTDEEIADLYNNMSDYFIDYCADIAEERNDETTPKDVWDKKTYLHPILPDNITSDNDDIIQEIQTKIRTFEEKNNHELCIGFDICLFQKDRILTNETLNMKLFHDLSLAQKGDQNKYTVFLYSSYKDKKDIIEEWTRIFDNKYNDLKASYIYDRDRLIYPDDNSKERKRFFSFLQKDNKGIKIDDQNHA